MTLLVAIAVYWGVLFTLTLLGWLCIEVKDWRTRRAERRYQATLATLTRDGVGG